jgi:hypothetical protein
LYAGVKRLPMSASNYGGEFVFFKDATSLISETASGASSDVSNYTIEWRANTNGNNTTPVKVATTSPAANINSVNPALYHLPAGVYNFSAMVTNDSNDWVDVKLVDPSGAVVATLGNPGLNTPWGTHGPFTGSFSLAAATDLAIQYSNGYYQYGTGVVLTLQANITSDVYAAVIADSFNCASDMNLKKNIVPLDGALDKIDGIRGVYHDWIDVHQSQGRQIGVIAQEVQAVYPELVSLGGNGFLSVNYPKLSAVLLQSVKELKAMVLAMKK